MQKKFYENNLKVLLSFQSLVFHNMHRHFALKWPGKGSAFRMLWNFFDEGNIYCFRENVQNVVSKTILGPKLWHRTENQLLVPQPRQIKRSQWPHKSGARYKLHMLQIKDICFEFGRQRYLDNIFTLCARFSCNIHILGFNHSCYICRIGLQWHLTSESDIVNISYMRIYSLIYFECTGTDGTERTDSTNTDVHAIGTISFSGLRDAPI